MSERNEMHPRRETHNRRRRQPRLAPVEALESRELMAYSPLGRSLPDLAILDAFTGPVAAYGGPLSVTLDIDNLGASTLVEPLALAPGATSSADATPTTVDVYMVRSPHDRPVDGVYVGTVNIPAIPQKRLARVTGTITLPAVPPPGFPEPGNTIYLTFKLDPNNLVPDYDRTNNVTRTASPVFLTPYLPQLETVAFNTPAGLAPGDAFVPQVKVANYGSGATILQAPVVVQVVASLDTDYGPGDVILAEFTVENIDPLSAAPTKKVILGDVNLTDPPNVVTLISPTPVVLPAMPADYFVGVKVDPFNQIREIDELDEPPSPALEEVKVVEMDPHLKLPPAGIIGVPNPSTNLFPNPPRVTSPTMTVALNARVQARAQAQAQAQAQTQNSERQTARFEARERLLNRMRTLRVGLPRSRG